MCANNAVPQMLGIKTIAERYGLPVRFVRALVNSGKVIAVREGNKILVNSDKFCEFLNSNRLQPANEDGAAKDHVDDTIESSSVGTAKRRIAPIPAGRGR